MLICTVLLKQRKCESVYLTSTSFQTDHGPIGTVIEDRTSSDIIVSTSSSITKLNFDMQTHDLLLSSNATVTLIESFLIRGKSYVFACSYMERRCYFLIKNATSTYQREILDVNNELPWTNDGSFTIPLRQDNNSVTIFIANNVHNTYDVSSLFSVIKISVEPPRLESIQTGISGLGIVSPHRYEVMTGLLYNDRVYLVVRIFFGRHPKPISTELLQIDFYAAKNRVISSRIRCGTSSTMGAAYFIKNSPETLFVSTETDDVQMLCGFEMKDVEINFQNALVGCNAKRRGSRIPWLDVKHNLVDNSVHEKLNPCFEYVSNPLFEPRSEKTGLRGFRPGPTQTGLYSHRRWPEA